MNLQPEQLVLGSSEANSLTLLYAPNKVAEEEIIGDNPDNLSQPSTGIMQAQSFYYPSSPRMMAMRSSMLLGANSLQPGEVQLNKNAEPVLGTDNQWTVTLAIEGKGMSQTSDIVLVIDKSGSMNDNKMANTILAAQEFVERLLQPNSTTRIAVVAFDGDYRLIEQNFTDYAGKEALKAKIAAIKAGGGTNIQAGIHQAKILLDASTGFIQFSKNWL
jgi:hypothetical protein